ncbi:MAG: helix-turn-helix domain-containing protein [Planctomycetes bacterium]|nr:helix-turn-helix domain-containing protein [Planctomycetota bacterium]
MSLASIIRSRREELGLTQEMVAARAGISKPYLSSIETGKTRNPPSDGVLRSLERVLTFPPGQLVRMAHLARTPTDVRERFESYEAEVQRLRGLVRSLRGGGPVGEDDEAADADSPGGTAGSEERPLAAGVVVPVINRVAAGYPHNFTDLDYPPGVADEYIRCPDVHDPQAFAARVVGDSMEPDYHEGDIVVFSPNLQARSGDDCFVRFGAGEETTFKRIYADDERTLRLQPLNGKYPAQICRREEITGLWPALFRIQRIRQG